MSKINQIEKALQEIDATKFHKLVDAYLSYKFREQYIKIDIKNEMKRDFMDDY